MITLPQLTTAPRLTGDAEANTSGDPQLQPDAQPQEFIALLGNRMLSLVQQSYATANPGTDAQQAEEMGNSKKGQLQSVLSTLVAALASPATADGLLASEKTKETPKTADDSNTLLAATLTPADQQNLQALFAMLPAGTVPHTMKPQTGDAGAQSLTRDLAGKSTGIQGQVFTLNPASQQGVPVSGESHVQVATLSAAVNQGLVQGPGSDPLQSQSLNQSLNQSQETPFQPLLNSLIKTEAKSAQAENRPDVSMLPGIPQNGAIGTASASATSPTPSIPMLNSQLGSPEWQQALSQQILLFSRNGQHSAELRLNPEELGAIQINLKLDKDQAQLMMVSGHSHVRAALEAAMPHLRTALAESGINLGQSNISSDQPTQGQSFGNQQQAQRDSHHNGFISAPENENEMTPLAVPASLQARIVGKGAVDTFA